MPAERRKKKNLCLIFFLFWQWLRRKIAGFIDFFGADFRTKKFLAKAIFYLGLRRLFQSSSSSRGEVSTSERGDGKSQKFFLLPEENDSFS